MDRNKRRVTYVSGANSTLSGYGMNERKKKKNGKIVAYLRAFEKDTTTRTVQIGRVLTLNHGMGLGGQLLKEGITQIREKLNPSTIYIEAQCYATGFYEQEGFVISSEEFLEDGIPHVEMILKL